MKYDMQSHTGAGNLPDQVHLKQSQGDSVHGQTERGRSRGGRRSRSLSCKPVAGRKECTLLKEESRTGKICNLLL